METMKAVRVDEQQNGGEHRRHCEEPSEQQIANENTDQNIDHRRIPFSRRCYQRRRCEGPLPRQWDLCRAVLQDSSKWHAIRQSQLSRLSVSAPRIPLAAVLRTRLRIKFAQFKNPLANDAEYRAFLPPPPLQILRHPLSLRTRSKKPPDSISGGHFPFQLTTVLLFPISAQGCMILV